MDPESTQVGAILTFTDGEAFRRHVAMVDTWEEFRAFAATVRLVDVRVCGDLSAESKAWITQFGVINRAFPQHVAGFVRPGE